MTWSNFSPTQFLDIFTYVNVETSGVFGYLLITSVFIISFISMKGWPTEKALLASSAITLLIDLPMVMTGITSYVTIAPCIIGMILGVIMSGGGE